jgi:hypothetical protein
MQQLMLNWKLGLFCDLICKLLLVQSYEGSMTHSLCPIRIQFDYYLS